MSWQSQREEKHAGLVKGELTVSTKSERER